MDTFIADTPRVLSFSMAAAPPQPSTEPTTTASSNIGTNSGLDSGLPFSPVLSFTTSMFTLNISRAALTIPWALSLASYSPNGLLRGVTISKQAPHLYLFTDDVITHVNNVSLETIFKPVNDAYLLAAAAAATPPPPPTGTSPLVRVVSATAPPPPTDISALVPHMAKLQLSLTIHRWTPVRIPTCQCGTGTGYHTYDCLDETSNESPYGPLVTLPPIPNLKTWLRERHFTWRRNSKLPFRQALAAPLHCAARGSEQFDTDETSGAPPAFVLAGFPTARAWLKSRKKMWRANCYASGPPLDLDNSQLPTPFLRENFWRSSHHAAPLNGFGAWLASQKSTWKLSYSWNIQKKRKLLTASCPSIAVDGKSWMQVRREQWRFERFKRAKRLQEAIPAPPEEALRSPPPPLPPPPTFFPNTLVTVLPRTWPGINKPGGAGVVLEAKEATDATDATVTVKYVMGGTDKDIPLEYVEIQSTTTTTTSTTTSATQLPPLPLPRLPPSQLHKLVSSLIDKTSQLDKNAIFEKPVTDKIAPGYSTLIGRPMCWSDVRRNLKNGVYDDYRSASFIYLATFCADVGLIYENCILYNAGGAGKKYRDLAARHHKQFRGFRSTCIKEIKAEEERMPRLAAAVAARTSKRKRKPKKLHLEEGEDEESTFLYPTAKAQAAPLTIVAPIVVVPEVSMTPTTPAFTPSSKRFKLSHSLYATVLREVSQEKEERKPFTMNWLIDLDGVPDDAVYCIFRFLPRESIVALTALSRNIREGLAMREHLFESMCRANAKKWAISRNPRGSWFTLYYRKLKEFAESQRKMSDETLLRGFEVIEKGDMLGLFKKEVQSAQVKFGFDINYISALVLERNSLINMAVISSRVKILKWLVSKAADLESHDRGGFTPLLNAAWNGDVQTTRYILMLGANRGQIGITHSSKPFVPGFKGLTAEGWARRKGFEALADEIKFGLG